MNRLLARFKELKTFEKRIFVFNNKQLLLSLKPLTYEQICFFVNEYQGILDTSSEADVLDFFYDLFETDDSYLFLQALNNDEFRIKILDWFFTDYLPFNDFKTHVFKGLTNAYKEINNDLFIFFQELISYGYNYLELSKLTSKALIELCFKELILRDYDKFLEFSANLSKNVSSDELTDFIAPLIIKRKAFLEEQKNPAAVAKFQSDFDMLESL